MKMRASLFVPVLTAGLLVHAKADIVTVYEVEALIDGTSVLRFQGSSLEWHNLNAQVPGKYNPFPEPGSPHDDPTVITTSVNGVTVMDHTPWYPIWSAPVFEGVLQAGVQTSDPFQLLAPPIPSHDIEVQFLQVSGRSGISIDSFPTQANNYQLELRFDDPLAGPENNRVRVTIVDRSTGPVSVPDNVHSGIAFGSFLVGLAIARRRFHRFA